MGAISLSGLAGGIIGAVVSGVTTGNPFVGFRWGYLAGSLFGAYFFSPKPHVKNAKPAALSDFSFTQCNEGIPLPLIYGTVKIPPNIIWYGNFKTEAVKEEVESGGKGGGHKSEDVVVGYKYYIDVWYGLAYAGTSPIEIIKVYKNEKPLNSLDQIECDYYLFNNGGEDTYPNIGENANRIKGVSHIFFKKFYVGYNNTVLPTLHFVLKRIPQTGLPYPEINSGCNPASFVYDILVSILGYNNIDQDSFISASNYFYNEGYGINIAITQQEDALSIINRILNSLNAFLVVLSNGKIGIKILNPDQSPIYTIDRILNLSFTKPSWKNVPNDFRANFVDENQDYTVRTIALSNNAAQILTNNKITETYDLTFIKDLSTASKLLHQISKISGMPRSAIKITTDIETANNISVGDVVTIKYDRYNMNINAIVIQKRISKFTENRADIDLIYFTEELFDSNWKNLQSSYWIPSTYDFVDFTKIKVLEIDNLGFDDNKVRVLVLISRETGFETGIKVYYSFDGTDYSYLKTIKTFSQYGTLKYDYSANTYDIDDANEIVYTPYKEYEVFSNLSRDQLFDMKQLAVIDNEIIAFQSYIANPDGTYSLKNIIRNLLWSSKADHLANSDIYVFKFGDNIIELPRNKTIYLKFVPICGTLTGDIATAQTITITPTLKSLKPLPPVRVVATRTSDTEVKVDVFVITKIKNDGAGKYSADDYTDICPFDYEGSLVVQIDNNDPYEIDTTNFKIEKSGSFTLYIKTKWNGFESDSVSLNIGTDIGEYLYSS